MENALAILNGVLTWNIEMRQPPHFVAEVAAVLAREKPDEALADLDDLLNIDFQVIEAAAIYTTATELSIASTTTFSTPSTTPPLCILPTPIK